jgi:hypothetical protein
MYRPVIDAAPYVSAQIRDVAGDRFLVPPARADFFYGTRMDTSRQTIPDALASGQE